jgi:hypothetical protein
MNPEDHSEYREMQAKGASPESIFLAAERQHDSFAAIRIVRAVFGLSLDAAKEVMIRAHGGAASLAEHQEQLLPSLKQALKDES